MKIFTLILLLIWNLQCAFSQLIVTDPVFPSDDQSVEVIFNAQLGNRGLAGYTGDVYAHTGVITNLSSGPSDWKYVKTDWGQNTPETKLEKIGTDLYKFSTGTQTIRQYYGVPASEEILQLAFVFRSATAVGGSYREGKTATNGDIYATVYPEGLFVILTEPYEYGNIFLPGTPITIEAVSNNADSLILYINDTQVAYSTENQISFTHTTASSGKHFIKVKTVFEGQAAYDSAYYYIESPVQTMAVPSGIVEGINYINDSTVILSLYAPQKQNVYVIGDFNNWEYSDEGHMQRSPDASRWWKEITGLEPGKEYVFQYLVNHEIRIADPYADKILDPWNDQYISNATYPDLIEYPFGKTNQPASVLQTAQAEYEWVISDFQRPAKENLVIYDLLVRDFLAKHDYQTLIDTLSYLKGLGINAIELMPVYEFEGNSSWGYNTAFHFAPDKYYGTKNNLKEFIDICHQNGIAVIFDIVLNHVFGSSPFARLYWDATNNRPASNNPWLNPVAKHDYNVGFDFNHESQATKNLVTRVVKYWMEEYNVDGYRFDLSKGFTQNNTLGNTDAWGKYDASRVAIWKNIGNTVWNIDEDFYMILEHFAENTEERELANYGFMLWGNLNHQYRQLVMGYTENSDIAGISFKTRGWNDPHLIGYMESHDEERLMYSIMTWGNTKNSWYNIKSLDECLRRIAAASAVFYTIPGPKMLWQFGELGYDYSIEYNGRTGEKPIKWDYRNNWLRRQLYDITAALINLRQTHEVFNTSDFTLSSGTGLIKKVTLRGSEMSVAVIANFDIYVQEVSPDFPSTGTWYDYFSGDSLNVQSLTDKIMLYPGDFRLFTSKKLTTPDVGLGLLPLPGGENNDDQMGLIDSVFPNPLTDQLSTVLNIEDDSFAELLLINTSGKVVKTLYKGKLSSGKQIVNADLSDLSAGHYFLHVRVNQKSENAKIIKL